MPLPPWYPLARQIIDDIDAGHKVTPLGTHVSPERFLRAALDWMSEHEQQQDDHISTKDT